MAQTNEVITLATKLDRYLQEMDIFGQIAVVNILLQLVNQRGSVFAKQAAELELELDQRAQDQAQSLAPHLVKSTHPN